MSKSSKSRILEVAHELFYRDGFRNVGLDQILNIVGVTKTTFYNHFESKDDLVLEVLRLHDRWWRDTFQQLLRKHGGDTPRGQLIAIGDALNDIFTDKTYNGCIFINVAVEFPLPHDPAHIAAKEHKHAMEDLLREIAGYAGCAEPARLARELAMVMEGAYVTQQVTRTPETSEVTRRLIHLLVEQHLPQPTTDAPLLAS
jgi:AcrR family transcriptional regulator